MREPRTPRGGRGRRPPIGEGRGGRPDREPIHPRPGHGRMRRGDVRLALLIALLDGPGHGYELMQALESKTEGRWRPSPGSVYPSLQMLADEDLVTSTERDGKRIFEITDAGREHANERVATSGLPWETMERGRHDHGGMRAAVRDLHIAAKQLGISGTPEAVERATEIVTQARKDLYLLLAES